MKVLVACEFSGTVRDAFTAQGCEAWSCDLEPSEKPGNHYQGDVRDILYENWDLLVAHPPCTYLTVTGNKWFKPEFAWRFPNREQHRLDAIEFFMTLARAPISKIAIENPVGIMSRVYRKPDQIIQPYQFGHSASKKTCLWLKGLPPILPTNKVDIGEFVTWKSGKRGQAWYYLAPKDERQKIRNRTFQGIADAFAQQWTTRELLTLFK